MCQLRMAIESTVGLEELGPKAIECRRVSTIRHRIIELRPYADHNWVLRVIRKMGVLMTMGHDIVE